MEGRDVVFHQAAHRAVFRSVEHPLATNRANVDGTLTMLVAARDAGATRFVYASSSSVYGGAEIRPTPESAPLMPRSPYAVSKLASEHYARVFWELFGTRDGVAPLLQRVRTPAATRQPVRGRHPVVHRRVPIRERHRRCTATDSRAGTSRTSTTSWPRTFSPGRYRPTASPGRRTTSVGARRARSSTCSPSSSASWDRRSPRTTRRHAAGDVKHTFADLSAARADLGYEPRVGVPEGLEHTVAWFTSR